MNWFDLDKGAEAAEDIYRFLVGLPSRVVKASRKTPNPLTDPGFTLLIKDLTSSLLEDTRGEENAALHDIQHAIDVDWPSFTKEKRNAALKKIATALGGVPDLVIPKVTKTIESAGMNMVKATKRASKEKYNLPIAASFTPVDELVVKHAAENQAFYIRNAYGKREAQLSGVARSVASSGLAKGFDKYDIAADMKAALAGTTADRSLSYFTNVASIVLVRSRSYSLLSSFQEAGIDSFVWSSALVEETCDACRFMDRKVFPVASALQRHIDVANDDDPESVVEQQPFLNTIKDTKGNTAIVAGKGDNRTLVARVTTSAVGSKDIRGEYKDAASPAKIDAIGCSNPPAHGRCFCTMEPHFGEGNSHAEPGAPSPKPAAAPFKERLLPYAPGPAAAGTTGGKLYTPEETAALVRPLPSPQAVVEEPHAPEVSKLVPSAAPTSAQKKKALALLDSLKVTTTNEVDPHLPYVSQAPWGPLLGHEFDDPKKGVVNLKSIVLIDPISDKDSIKEALQSFDPKKIADNILVIKYGGKHYMTEGYSDAVAANLLHAGSPKKDMLLSARILDFDAMGVPKGLNVEAITPGKPLPKPPTKAQLAAIAAKQETEAILAAAAEAKAKAKAKHEAEVAALIAEMEAKAAKDKAAAEAAAKLLQHPSPATHGAPAAPHVTPEHVDAATILGTKLSDATGSNPGGVYLGTDGVKRYVKRYEDAATSPEMAANARSQAHGEHVTNQIYTALGLGAPKSSLTIGPDGKLLYASEIIEDGKIYRDTPKSAALSREILKGSVADMLTANWDAIGVGNNGGDDNILIKNGRAYRIDNGGSLLMRGLVTNGRKPESTLDKLTEWDRFFDENTNKNYARMASIAGVKSLADESIKHQTIAAIKDVVALHESHGSNWRGFVDKANPLMPQEDRKRVAQMLEARTALLKDKLTELEAKPKPAPKPGEARYVAKQYSTVTPRAGLTIEELPSTRAIEDHYGKQSRRDPTATYSGEKIGDYLKRSRAATKDIDSDSEHWINKFTGSYSTAIRDSESRGHPDAGSVAITKAFGKATPEPGTVFRAMDSLPLSVIKAHMEADVIKLGRNNTDSTSSTSWNIDSSIDGFMSGRRDHSDSHQYKLLYVLKQKTGIPIEHISQIGYEHEILMKRDAKFKITGLSRAAGTERVLIVEAEEIVEDETDSTGAPAKKKRAPRKKKSE